MMDSDNIEDAEWEEVPGNSGSLHIQAAETPKPNPADKTKADDDFRPYDPGAKFEAAVVRVAKGFGIIVVILVAAILVRAGIETLLEPAKPPEMDAQMMLTEWSRSVTGNPDDGGLILIDGDDAPGSLCDIHRASKMMRFGGIKLLNKDGVDIFDAFMSAEANQEHSIEGAFWFEPSTNTLTIRNAARVTKDGTTGTDIPDQSLAVSPTGEGHVEIEGTIYHNCVRGK